MSDLDRLRKEIEARYKSVTNKINRTRKTTGANVAGSEFDPRRKAGVENRMRSENNMRAYLSELNDFMRRPNQFVSGQNGAPIPRGAFQIYKKNEAEVEAIRNSRDASMGDIQTPTGLSVRQQKAAIPEAGGSSVYGPYRHFDRQASDFKDFASMQKLNKDLLKRLKADFLPSELDKGRANIEKVAEYLGETEIADQINNLTDYQFDLLWFGTTYADKLFLYYELEKERREGTHKERRQDRVVETAFAGIGELIEWAEQQSPEGR